MSRIYLYGFAPAGTALPDAGLLGVGDGEVEIVEQGAIAAVVSPVPEEGFDDATLEERSGDLAWMAEQGVRHEQVVAWFVDHASILPSRLLTLFSGREAVAAAVARDHDRIRDTLERLADVCEWNLKVGYDPDRIEARLAEVSEPIAELDREIAGATPGKRFLLQRKRKDLARSEGREAARRLARDLLAALEPMARESRRMPAPADDAPVLLNAALLVPRSSEADLADRAAREAERLRDLGVTLQLSGPWAPYRFLDPADD